MADRDTELMLGFIKGNKDAFDELLNRYTKPIMNFIYRIIGDRKEAEDLTQEVFLRVYQSANRYKPKAKFSTWIYRIAKNLSLNELRRRRRKVISIESGHAKDDKQPDKELAVEGITPYNLASLSELKRQVKNAVNSLPSNQKTAIILRRYQDLSYEDIASVMNCSISAVKSLLNRAKVNLTEKLRPYIRD